MTLIYLHNLFFQSDEFKLHRLLPEEDRVLKLYCNGFMSSAVGNLKAIYVDDAGQWARLESMYCALKIFRAQTDCHARNGQSSVQNLKIIHVKPTVSCEKVSLHMGRHWEGGLFHTRKFDEKNIFRAQKTNFPVWEMGASWKVYPGLVASETINQMPSHVKERFLGRYRDCYRELVRQILKRIDLSRVQKNVKPSSGTHFFTHSLPHYIALM